MKTLSRLALFLLAGCYGRGSAPAPDELHETPLPQETAARMARIAMERSPGVRLTRVMVEVAPTPDSYVEGRAPSTEAVHAILSNLVRDPHFARHKAEWGGADESSILFGLRGPVHVHPRVATLAELRRTPPPGLADLMNTLRTHDPSGKILRLSQLRMMRTVTVDHLWRQTLYDFEFTGTDKESVTPEALLAAFENLEAHLPLLRTVRFDLQMLEGTVTHAIVRLIVYHPPLAE